MIPIKKICIGALVVRLIVLTFVVFFSHHLTTGFLSSEVINDDVRYQLGAELYAQQAKTIFDYSALGEAFLQQGDHSVYSGYIFILWYWIVSVAMYVFHSHIAVRIMNILFAVYSVKCIYDITIHLYGKKTATYASLLYAYLPYPVFFSCFLYKDQFYTMILLMIFKIVVTKGAGMKMKDFVLVSLLIIVSTFLRSGLSVFIAVIVIFLYFNSKGYSLTGTQMFLVIPILLVLSFWLLQYNLDSIESKYMAYVVRYNKASEGVSSFLSIKSIYEFYRYPLSLLFVMLLPISNSTIITSWLQLVGWINTIILPVAISNLIFLLNWKIKKDKFYWCIQALYLVTIITSMGIFRHSYYLQPYMMIFFALFYNKINNKNIFWGVSAVMVGSFLILKIV